jgi:hypothetical protein
LMNGDILGSLRYNITVLFLFLLLTLFYFESVISLFGKKIKLVPRGNWFIYGSFIIFLIYFIVRNFIPYLTPEV